VLESDRETLIPEQWLIEVFPLIMETIPLPKSMLNPLSKIVMMGECAASEYSNTTPEGRPCSGPLMVPLLGRSVEMAVGSLFSVSAQTIKAMITSEQPSLIIKGFDSGS